MRLTYTDYLELPAPLAAVLDFLRDPQVWADAVGAEQLGTLWRHGRELYTLAPIERLPGDQPALRLIAETATGLGPRIEATLQLHDALISTHAALQLTLELPGWGWPWRQQQRWRLRRATRSIATRLVGQLRALEVPLVAPARPVAVAVTAGSAPLEDRPAKPVGATPEQAALVASLRTRYPLTVQHFLAMGALDHLERVARLERGWERIMRGEYDPAVHQLAPGLEADHGYDFELIYAGGGLGLLHATVMAACHGRRVMVFDRGEVGCAHREWNISRNELQALVDTGVVSWEELAPVIMREYHGGTLRFHNRHSGGANPASFWLPEVLNLALDAGALLRLMRRKLEAAGGVILSGRRFRTVRVSEQGPLAIEVELERVGSGVPERYSARLLLDGMGSTSPLALLRHKGRPFAGVCPTVGTVATGFVEGPGLREVDPSRGDILVSVADAQRGEQLIWEGFPGREREMTVYVFYYATVDPDGRQLPARGLHPDAPRYSLLDLYEQYFLLLPSYKQPGPHFQHVRPVYGYIPARHSLRRQEVPLLRGVLPVGDSAAQQSPLTFCGFGAHVRNLRRTTALLEHALQRDLLEPEHLAHITTFQANVALHWVFSRFMHPWDQADDINWLQNLFVDVLHELGRERATRLFRDQMRWSDFVLMLLGIYRRWPRVWPVAWEVLGPVDLVRWVRDYARFSLESVRASTARAGGPMLERAVEALADRLSPAAGLTVRATYAEWRAMGWV